jgi:isopenicillin-N N-acyltransferase-like protein
VTANGHTYVGQNWDWAPDIQETIILICIKQEPKPSLLLVDEAGMIGRMGINTAGIALASNTLLTEETQPAVPYNVLLRGILNQTTLADAIAALVQPARALAANYLFGDGAGQVLDIEASPSHTDIIAPTEGIVTHGNHFDGARLKGRDLSLERFPDSAYRPCRLRDQLRAAAPEITESAMQEALQDRFGFPNSISRAADPAKDPREQLETVASIIFDATEQRLLIHRGAPEGGEYTEFQLASLAGAQTQIAA